MRCPKYRLLSPVIAFREASAAQDAPGVAVTEYFFGRQTRRGNRPDRPEKLESPEDIVLAEWREGLFDQRSRRKTREDNARFGLVERGVWLAVGVTVVMLVVIRDPIWSGIASPIQGGVTAAIAWLMGSRSTMRLMPVYEFECEGCGSRFEELAPSGTPSLPCPECGSERTRRLMSPVSPAGRQPRGAAVRSDESRRGEREAARGERIAESKRKRAAGESVRPRRDGGGT